MTIGIGVDTGGTYTDIVAYDFDKKEVVAKGKALTTKENLAIGIGQAMDTLPADLLREVRMIALSTTLATNACVENKGGRAKLILMGTTRKVLEWIKADSVYGISNEEVLCIDTKSSFDGSFIDEPNWEELVLEEHDWFSDAQALSIAEVNALKNGAICEKNAKAFLKERYNVPVVMASELVSGLNIMERGATALLNARLLPVIEAFMDAISHALSVRKVNIPAMVVRSDGNLMIDQLSRIRPVETILSGPASSVLGGRGLTRCDNCLIVDMGGTTTDISIVEEGMPAVTEGIRIGAWKTQMKGVYIDTFGLGGDSAIYIENNKLQLSSRRVQPLCVAAVKWPQIKKSLEYLLTSKPTHWQPLHEFLYLVGEPQDLSKYNTYEVNLIETLKDGPCMLGSDIIDVYNLKSERLEAEGVIMRCGLTPTDMMHIKGDFSLYDQEASRLASEYFINYLPEVKETEDKVLAFADEVYDLVKQKLYENIVRLLITKQYPKVYQNGLGEQLNFLISQSWMQRKEQKDKRFFGFDFNTIASLVGIGAPTHIFLPEVADVLGTECIIPEHAEVANAVGAITADLSAQVIIEISPRYSTSGITAYIVHTDKGNKELPALEDAIEIAKEEAIASATREVRTRGALGELLAKTKVTPKIAYTKEGTTLDLGTYVTATVRSNTTLDTENYSIKSI